MKSTLLNPTPKALAAALEKAVKEANKKLTDEHCLVAGDNAPAVLATCAESREGCHYWRGSQLTANRQWAFASLAWWTDSLDRKHVRVAGGRCEADAPAATDGVGRMPAVWHVFPEFCYFADKKNPGKKNSDKKNSVEVLLVCGCGAWGTAEATGWAGDCCGRCHQRREDGQACPPAATLSGRLARFTPDGRGLIYEHTEEEIAYLDLQTGTKTVAPVKSKELDAPIVFNPDQPECLLSIGLALQRWNWHTNGKLVPAGRRAVVEFGLIVMEDGSPDGKWIGGRHNFRPIDWSKKGNPVGKGFQYRRDPKTRGVPYTSGRFSDDGRWIGVTAKGQIDAVDPETGTGMPLKPAGDFLGLGPDAFGPDVKAQAEIMALNWAKDLVCLAFTCTARICGSAVLMGSIRAGGAWQRIPWPEEDRTVGNLLGFTPDGRGLLSGRRTNTLEIVPLGAPFEGGGGSRALSFALPDYREEVCRVDFSPDGQSMILTTCNSRREGLGTPTDWYVRRIPYSAAAIAGLFQSHRSHAERFSSGLPVANRPANTAEPDAAPAENAFAPCRIHEDGEGQCWLSFTDFHALESVFVEFGHDGGGYGWHGVVDALLRKSAPALKRKLEFDPEASELLISSKSRAALEQVAKLIQSAIADPELLRTAIKNANPKLMG